MASLNHQQVSLLQQVSLFRCIYWYDFDCVWAAQKKCWFLLPLSFVLGPNNFYKPVCLLTDNVLFVFLYSIFFWKQAAAAEIPLSLSPSLFLGVIITWVRNKTNEFFIEQLMSQFAIGYIYLWRIRVSVSVSASIAPFGSAPQLLHSVRFVY